MKTIVKKTTGALAVAAALVAGVCTSCSTKSEKTIGIQLYSVMDAVKANPEASLQRLAEMGYNAAELVQWGGDPNVFGLPAADFKALCDRYGIDIISTYFVIPSYQADYTVAGVQRMSDYFNRVGRVAAEYGLKLGYHNHSGEFTQLADSNAVMWEYLVEHTDPAYVCFELDVYWCSKGEKSPVEYLRKYPDRIEMLHIKDDFVIGASGTIDFKGIFEQFYANGMKDYVVEIETPGWLREKKNADGTPYSQEQIMDEMFQAAAESADWLSKADFVK